MMRFRGPGCYKTTVTYRDENIGNNVFDVLVLNGKYFLPDTFLDRVT